MVYPGKRSDAMKRDIDRLQALLQDPQPGLISWQAAIAEAMKELNADYYERYFSGQ